MSSQRLLLAKEILSFMEMEETLRRCSFFSEKYEKKREVISAPSHKKKEPEKEDAVQIVPKRTPDPSTSFSEMKALISKVAPSLSILESPGFLFLFIPTETADLAFWERLKEAITLHIHPAKLIAPKNKRELLSFLELPHFKLGLIPQSLFSSFFPEKEINCHQLTSLSQSPLILLHEASRYQSDLLLKKELWNQLKSNPTLSLLRSSST